MRVFATEAADFTPDLLTIQEQPPARLPRTVGYVTAGLFGVLLTWAAFGKLDIIAGAEGRLVPRNYSRVLQPAEAGIVREVLVRDGDRVLAGQVLMRMDATTAGADMGTLRADAALKALSLRRIDAELRGQPLLVDARDPPELATQVLAQYRARRQSYLDALAQEQATLARAQHDLAAARQQLAKLQATVPLYQQSASSYEKLVKEGFVSELGANDKIREKIEKEQELKTRSPTWARWPLRSSSHARSWPKSGRTMKASCSTNGSNCRASSNARKANCRNRSTNQACWNSRPRKTAP